MPKRTDQVTDLEKYFWKAESIQKLLGTDCAERLLKEAGYKGKTAIGSKEFVRVAGELGHLERYYRKQDKDMDAQGDGSGKSAGSRPTYIFPKCLACRMITQLDSETKRRLASHFDRIELGRLVLSKKELQLEIWDMVTDTDLMELLETQCYFQTDTIVKPDKNGLSENEEGSFHGNVSQDSKICWMHGTDLCSPQVLVDLCSIFKQGRGKGKPAFTYADLEDMGKCFCKLYPVAFSEDAYIGLLEKQKDTIREGQNGKNIKKTNVVSSNSILRHGIESETSKSRRQFVKDVEEWFKHYFGMQFKDKDRAGKWFERLTQRYYQLRKYSLRQDNLHVQIQRWRNLWEYVICRYTELRCEERKQIEKEKHRPLRTIDLEVLLEQIFWEYSHEKVYVDAARKKVENVHEEGIMPDVDLNERETMLEKYQGEINFIIDKLLPMHKKMREISPEDEITRLTGKAFYDLERMVRCITLGWAEDKSKRRFTKRIIKGALDSQRMKLKIDD